MRTSNLKIVIRDLVESYRKLPLSIELALEDLRDQYRRSYIGMGWIVLSFLALFTIKALVFSPAVPDPNYDFFSHLAIGFAVFTFITKIIIGAANLFVSNKTWMLSSNLPYPLYANTMIFRAFFELALLGIAVFLLVSTMGYAHPGGLWSLPFALALYYVQAIGLCGIFAPLGAKIRDFTYTVQAVTRILFFATPIIWTAPPGTVRGMIAQFNPLTYYIDLVREPLIVGVVPTSSWLVASAVTAVTLVLGLVVFTITRKWVAYWL